jgi:hypothetical protein
MFWTGLLHVVTADSISGAASGFRMTLDPDCERLESVSLEPHAGQGGIPDGPKRTPGPRDINHGDGRRVPVGTDPVVCSYGGVAQFGGDDGASERPLPLAGCASLRAACGRACVGSLRERSAPFEVPPDAG